MPNILRKEKRQYPRIKARLPLEIISKSGEVLPAVSLDMSLDGLQIECDHKTQQQLVHANEKHNSGQPVEMDIQIQLPLSQHSLSRMEMRCRLVITRRLAQNTYHLGLNYLKLEDATKLDEFLNNQLSKSA